MTALRLETTREKINPFELRCKRYSLEEKKQHLLFLFQRTLYFPEENITAYASRHQLSRRFLYQLQSKTELSLAPLKSGPKEKTSPVPLLPPLPSILLNQESTEESCSPTIPPEMLSLLGSIPSKIGEKAMLRFLRTFLSLLSAPLSLNSMNDTLKEAFGVELSKDQFCALSHFFFQKAKSLLDEVDPKIQLNSVGLDEMYSSDCPVFVGLELKTKVLFLALRQTKCTGKLWKSVLKGKKFKKMVSDQGKALNKGVRKYRKQHQWDLAHLKKNLKKFLKVREAIAYEKIKKEYEAQKKAKKSISCQEKYQRIQSEVKAYLEDYDPDEKAVRTLLEGLEIFDEEGELKDLEKNIQERKGVCERLRTSKNRWARYIGRTYGDERVWRFQNVLWKKLERVKIRWRWKISPEEKLEVLRIMSFKHFEEKEWKNRWKRKSREKAEVVASRRKEMEEFMEWKKAMILEEEKRLKAKIKNYGEVEKAVNKAFQEMLRSSSEVEGINSRLRLMQQTKKGLSQGFLDFWRWKYNSTAFKEGKDKGKSPYELAGVRPSGYDWKKALLAA